MIQLPSPCRSTTCAWLTPLVSWTWLELSGICAAVRQPQGAECRAI